MLGAAFDPRPSSAPRPSRGAAGPSFGRFHVAFTAWVAEALEEPGSRLYDVEDRMLVLQMGAVAGVTF